MTNTTFPRDAREYSRIEYWDRRFVEEEEYEWCGRFSDFADLLVEALSGGGGKRGGKGGGKEGKGGGDAAPAQRVLILGSGTSRLPLDLAEASHPSSSSRAEGGEDGESLLPLLPELEEIVATDLSRVAVEKMAAKTTTMMAESTSTTKTKGGARITWEVADMLSLPFEDGSFDAVVDKGVLDALFAGFSSSG